VRQGPPALTAGHVALSKLSIITGPNSSGKSVLLNLLARAGRDPLPGRCWLGELSADIQWFDPQPHLLQFSDRDGSVELLHDSRPAPSLAAPYRVVTARAPYRPVSGADDLAGLLGLSRTAFLDLLREVPRCVRGDVAEVDVTGEVPVVRLLSAPDPVRIDDGVPRWATALLLLEAAIALAQARSLEGPTLLLVDDFGDCLHPAAARRVLAVLAAASQGFQTVVVTHQPLSAEVRADWTITTIGHEGHAPLLLPEERAPGATARHDGP
jgi:hypothetical protein